MSEIDGITSTTATEAFAVAVASLSSLSLALAVTVLGYVPASVYVLEPVMGAEDPPGAGKGWVGRGMAAVTEALTRAGAARDRPWCSGGT